MSEAGSTGRQGADGLKARIDRMRDRLLQLSKTMPPEQRLRDGLSQGSLSALAAVVAYLPTQALGLREGFWGAITALAVAQAELGTARSTGRDQLAGATIGGGIGVATVLAIGASLPGHFLAVVLSVLACWCVNIASASRLAAITATIILLVPHTGTPQHMLLSRVGEVGWGALVALGLVWLRERVTRR